MFVIILPLSDKLVSFLFFQHSLQKQLIPAPLRLMYFLAGRLLCGFLHEQAYIEMRAFYMQIGPLKRIGINLSEVNYI